MGYKLAGFDHLGGIEIDPKIAKIYKTNHKPKYMFQEDIRLFNSRSDLPEELFNLDILDGSPPCTSFTMSGTREKDWGKEKKFKEGNILQRLDDLVFAYVDTIKKLKPKVAILENVKGLVSGNAKSYAKRIQIEMSSAGYFVQAFVLNSATMGVPQRRERVFFIGLRSDFHKKKLKLSFGLNPIRFSDVYENGGVGLKKITDNQAHYLSNSKASDKTMAHVRQRLSGKFSGFNDNILNMINVCPTVTAGGVLLIRKENRWVSKREVCLLGSYPLDYDFMDIDPIYLIGMSVPPVMIASIAHEIFNQWLS